MYRSDKITSIGSITTASVFGSPERSFYLFFSPKTIDDIKVAIVNGRLVDDTSDKKIPVVPNEWNPMVFSSLDITEDILSKYDVFIGYEG